MGIVCPVSSLNQPMSAAASRVETEPVAGSGEPVTVMVERAVEPGRERDFEAWLDELLAAAGSYPGFLGSGVLRPHRPGEPWHIVYRFADQASQYRWEASPERAEWLARGDGLMEERAVHRVTGLETWFTLPGRSDAAPPRWKMALVVFAAVYPIALTINLLVLPHVAGWAVPLKVAMLSGIMVPTMTWVVMPTLTRAFRRWLYPG